ncbi:hypothetical protein MSAN_01104400 [Mycena sanguinolenta]|uniref:Uncharacterized protein n=1 Tax=Mycena sanguinolenta TaxID=230812 RepID=A0A8H7D6U1_9AGAR|nr:hypothetical protein MSAN_01104400 [Mycena sanguinolenta]
MKIITNAEAAPSDFLKIPRGNVILGNEIRFDAARGIVRRDREGKSVRRMYSARVVGYDEPMTVTLYEGENAEKEWKCDLSLHSRLWYGGDLIAYCRLIKAITSIPTYFKFMPVRDRLESMLRYFMTSPFANFSTPFGTQYSAFLKAYILWYLGADLHNAAEYCARILPEKEPASFGDAGFVIRQGGYV